METQKPDLAIISSKTTSVKEVLLKQCKAMISYSLKVGKSLDNTQVLPLTKGDDQIKVGELIPAYNYLVALVKPAQPGTLVLFDQNRESKSYFRTLGPLPIVRWFMLLSILSLLALILTSLSSNVNDKTMQMSMLEGDGIQQIERLAFLLAAASVGASFYALFKMNGFIQQGTFDMKYASTYWSRFVLGLVAGVLLSELFVGFVDSGVSSAVDTTSQGKDGASSAYLIKPILAILGGFSANLVYRILSRLIEAVESVFKGSADEMVANKEQQMAMESTLNEGKLKNASAGNLLSLKQKLINSKVSQSVLDELDASISHLISTPLTPPTINKEGE